MAKPKTTRRGSKPIEVKSMPRYLIENVMKSGGGEVISYSNHSGPYTEAKAEALKKSGGLVRIFKIDYTLARTVRDV